MDMELPVLGGRDGEKRKIALSGLDNKKSVVLEGPIDSVSPWWETAEF
jgi:hypothetical protein